MTFNFHFHEIAVADPGLPRGGDTNPRGEGGGGTIYNFAKFSQKLHEIERLRIPLEARVSSAPIRSAIDFRVHNHILLQNPFSFLDLHLLNGFLKETVNVDELKTKGIRNKISNNFSQNFP